MYLSRRAFTSAQRRSFVSTVLLSRTWDKETLVDLRKEAKARGLSTKGNKSTLIARIREHEENIATSSPSLATSRNASTNVAPPKKTSQAASPGIPLTMQPDSASTKSNFLVIKLPNLSQQPPIAPVQVPYVPDFWNSARSKPDVPLDPELPKLHVIGGSATHYDGGPTHILAKHREDTSSSTTAQVNIPTDSKEVGFWADVWESLGVPRSFSARRTLASNIAAQAAEHESRTHSRPLTVEERKGLYILLSIVGGSWLVGALVNRPAVAAEEYDTQTQH